MTSHRYSTLPSNLKIHLVKDVLKKMINFPSSEKLSFQSKVEVAKMSLDIDIQRKLFITRAASIVFMYISRNGVYYFQIEEEMQYVYRQVAKISHIGKPSSLNKIILSTKQFFFFKQKTVKCLYFQFRGEFLIQFIKNFFILFLNKNY